MRKKLKSKVRGLDVLAVCRTNEEHWVMMILIVYCQHFYRKFKREKKPIRIKSIIDEARAAWSRQQAQLPRGEKSEFN